MLCLIRRLGVYLLLFVLGGFGFWIVQQTDAAAYRSTHHPTLGSHALALTADGTMLAVANPDSNSVTLINTSNLNVTAEIAVGSEPRSVAILGRRAFVANQGSDSLTIFELDNPRASLHIPVGDRPVAVVVSPDGSFLAVAEMGRDTVRLMDADSLDTLVVYPVQDRPYGLCFTPEGNALLVSHLLSGQVSYLPVLPYRQFIPLVHLPQVTPDQSSSVSRSGSIPTWQNVAPAPAVLVNAAGTRAYLAQTMANGLGYNTRFDTTVFPKVSVLDLQAGAHLKAEHIPLPETDQPVGLPWDLALAKEDRELWVVNAGSNGISIIDLSNTTQPTRQAHIPVGANPRAILFSPDGLTAYVNNTLAGTVSVIDTQTYTVTQVITSTQIPLPPLLLEGKRLFHSSARPDLAQAAWISCNTCHIEGEHDGRTWLLQYLGSVPPGEEPVIARNTTSLLGMIETYPLRWSAEWDESADSEFSIRFEQFGSGLISGDMHPTLGPPNQGRSAELDALAAFIDSLVVPEREQVLNAAELRGKALFASPATQCLSCHPPPLFTDLQQHDVGTASGPGEWFGPSIDTPTLRFLYDSAPYLHDGSATTLYEVLTSANLLDEHGVTSHLSEQQLRDLIAFLLSLPYE